MKIVIDTNVSISAVFFGGLPLKVLQTVIEKKNEAYLSPEIWDEYGDVIERMTRKYPSRLRIISPAAKGIKQWQRRQNHYSLTA